MSQGSSTRLLAISELYKERHTLECPTFSCSRCSSWPQVRAPVDMWEHKDKPQDSLNQLIDSQVNPTITFATMITGLTGFSRGNWSSISAFYHGTIVDQRVTGILYMLGQLLGSAIAGGVLRGSFGRERSIAYHGGGCFRDAGSVSVGQAFLIEVFSVFAFL